jgi:hypothetical protein
MKKTHDSTLLHNGMNVKHSLVGCCENCLPTCTLCNYSKVVIRNAVEQDDKLLIGWWHKFKQNKNRYDLKSINHTNFWKRNVTSKATERGLYKQTQFSTKGRVGN